MASDHSESKWKRRHTVVLLCFFSTFICYIDRVNISVAIIPMAEQFVWTDTQRGRVASTTHSLSLSGL